MVEILNKIPNWFLVALVAVLLFLCATGLNHTLIKLNQSLDDFKRLIEKLFEKHENHESRLSRLEGEHVRYPHGEK